MKKLIFIFLLFPLLANAQISITEAGGWLESAYAKWAPYAGATGYRVYYTGQGHTNVKIDNQLIRSYGSYLRADVLGLAAGTYTLKIVPVIGGVEEASLASTTTALTVKAHVREGYAFSGGVVPGAYNMDGTPKAGAVVLYLTEANANTITCDVKNDKGVASSYSGIMNILAAKGKGYDKTPLIIRFLGAVRTVSGLNASNFFYFGGFNNSTRMIENITAEGVGNDGTAYGYGFGFKRSKGIEVRNLGIMMFGDDGVGMDTDNFNNWVHNCDFFYGKPGSDADQVKGDGSIDLKSNSTNITLSFNHFWDSGKVMGIGGATGETSPLLITYHHNWFDHADSRCPRLTNTNSHVYNNYYDGVAKYGVGTAKVTSVFVEANYFRGYQRPITISGQGTDTWDSATGTYTLDGTFSGQAGGMAKAFGNVYDNCIKYVTNKQHATQFDAYEVDSRSEQIPATVAAVTGGYTYINFDTEAGFYSYTPENATDAKASVVAYAGRMQGGDLKWIFNNAVDDYNSDVNLPLKTAIVAYQSAMVAIQSEAGVVTSIASVLNPTNTVVSNRATRSLNITSSDEIEGVIIYTSRGQVVMNIIPDGNTIEVQQIPNGIYIVKLLTTRGATVHKVEISN